MTSSDQSTSLVEVDIVRSARRRTVALHVSARGKVEVRAPVRVSQQEISAFVERHRDWILRKVAVAAASPPWQPLWVEGGQWFWQGNTVLLASGGPRSGLLVNDTLALPLNANASAEQWQHATFLWHRRVASDLLRQRSEILFAEHCAGHHLRRVDLRWMRATWGTCSGKRGRSPLGTAPREIVLRLNPWLASLPPALCDAILLHELAHVEHMNHGAGFYRRLAVLNPDWRAHDIELKRWARLLFPITAG